MGDVLTPRNFVLIEELEKGEKGLGAEGCSYGLSSEEDATLSNWDELSNWDATILGPPRSVHENRIYNVKIYCGPEYPDEVPFVQFISRINLSCVDEASGKVDPAKLEVLKKWKAIDRSLRSMEAVLIDLRKLMASSSQKKIEQPREGLLWDVLQPDAEESDVEALQANV